LVNKEGLLMSRILENYPLFKECIDALGTNLLSEKQSEELSALFMSIFPITKWGKIDWDKIDMKIDVGCDPAQIVPALQQLLKCPVDKTVYIEWSSGGLPVIKTDLDSIIRAFDDVTCVAFEKFIFNPKVGYIVEILPGDKITVGVVRAHNA
jgi:hypothetical protein